MRVTDPEPAGEEEERRSFWQVPMRWRLTPGGWRVLALGLFVARLLEGSVWFSGFTTKRPDNGFGWFPGWVASESQYSPIPPYKWFLDTLVLPHVAFWGWVQFLTEAVLAVTTLLGILVGFSGILATIWSLNIAIGSVFVPGETLNNEQNFVLIALLLWVTRSGRVWGVDAWLRPKLLASRKRWVRWVGEWGT